MVVDENLNEEKEEERRELMEFKGANSMHIHQNYCKNNTSAIMQRSSFALKGNRAPVPGRQAERCRHRML